MAQIDPINFILNLPPEIIAFIEGTIALALVAISYKLISRYLNRVGKRLELDDHSLNSIRLVIRVLTILAATSILFSIYELPTRARRITN